MNPSPSLKKNVASTWFFRFFLFFLCCALLFTASLPPILSSTWGKEKLIAFINESIPGKINIENLQLSWFGPQKFHNISLVDPQKHPVINIENLYIDASLFSLTINPKTAGSLKIDSLNAKIVVSNEGNTNLLQALDKTCCQTIENKESPITILLKNVNASLNLSKKDPISLQLTGETELDMLQGHFLVEATMQGISLEEIINGHNLTEFLKSQPGRELKFHADIINFPLELIDQIAALRSPHIAGLITQTLGNQLNLKIDQEGTPTGISLNIQTNTPTLSADANILIDNKLTLSKPALAALKISPFLADKLISAINMTPSWHLNSPITATLSLTQLQLPLTIFQRPLREIDINTSGLTATLDIEKATFRNSTNEQFSINKLHTIVSTEAQHAQVDITLSSEALHNGKPTNLDFAFSLPKNSFLKNFSKAFLKDLTIIGSVKNAPLSLIDSHSPLLSILGSNANLSFSLGKQDDKSLATIEYKSNQLEIPRLSFLIDEKITLQKPTKIILQINQQLVGSIFDGNTALLQGPATVQLLLNTLAFPLNNLSNSFTMIFKADLDAQIKVSSMRLVNVPMLDAISLNDFTFQFLTNPKTRPSFNTSFSLQPDGSNALANVAGKNPAFKGSATIGIGLDGNPIVSAFNVQALSDIARLDISGEIQEGNHLILNPPTMLSYTFTEAGLESLGIANAYRFKQKTPLEITLDSSHINLNLKDLSRLQLHGKLKISDFQLKAKTQKDDSFMPIIDNLLANWSIDGEKKLFTLNFNGITRLGENLAAGKINGAISIDQWLQQGSINLKQAKIAIDAHATKLPTELLSALSGKRGLVPILGHSIDLTVEAKTTLTSSEKGIIAINIKSENLAGNISLTLNDSIQLTKNKPAEFSLKLTPQGYAALRYLINNSNDSDFILSESSTIIATLQSLKLSRSQSFLEAAIEGDFSLDKIVGIDSQTKNKISLNTIQGSISSENLSTNINFNILADGHNEQNDPSSWKIIGSLANGFSADGSLNKENLSLAFDAKIHSLPIPLFCQFACLNPKLTQKIEVLLGSIVNANANAKLHRMNGPIYLEVNGNNGGLTLDATLNNGIMVLNKDLIAYLKVTPNFSEYTLKDFFPIMQGILSADQPIRFAISKDGFSLPVNDPSIMSIKIRQATLNMGKVHFSSQSHIAKVLSLLTTVSAEQTVWMTPIYFSLNQGNLDLARVDMLINDQYPIAAWGDIDLSKDKVNMIIGLFGSAIAQAFHVPGISNSYLLQIPLKGKLNNASIDKTKAVARISALVAQSQGGPHGLVIGTVLDIATGGLTEPSVPAPTTDPLPWSDMLQDSSPPDSQEKSPLKPIKEMKKEASSFLKKIFKP